MGPLEGRDRQVRVEVRWCRKMPGFRTVGDGTCAIVCSRMRLQLIVGASSVSVIGFTVGLLPSPALATSCGDLFRFHCCPQRFDVPIAQAIDFAPWAVVDEFHTPMLLAAECRFRDVEGVEREVAATVSATPMSGVDAQELERGCGIEERFAETIVRFTPSSPLAPNTEYDVTCKDIDAIAIAFPTGEGLADPAPAIEVIGTRIDDSVCTDVPALWLDIAGIEPGFFDGGGMIIVEYAEDRADYAQTPLESSRDDGVFRVPFWLPMEDDDTITVRAVNGAGVPGLPVQVDVSGIGEDDRASTCGVSPRASEFVLIVLGLLPLRRRRSCTENRRAL
jgi:hypothetical protein